MKRQAINSSVDAHRAPLKDFCDAARAIESREGWRPYEVMANWLEAAFRALRAPFLADGALTENEAEYMRIVGRCRADPTATMENLSRMLSATIAGLEAEPVDFIGPVFSEYAADAGMGQFFTPTSLSVAMARMILADAKSMIEASADGFISCAEPACGVGGMVLAASLVLREQGVNIQRQVHWQAVDIGHRAMCGAYIQSTLCGVSADVIRGDTLRLQEWMTTPTFSAVFFPKRHSRVGASTSDKPAAAPKPSVQKPTQLAFGFDGSEAAP